LQDDAGAVTLVIGNNHIRATTEEFTFTSKLVDGKFPEYERVLPRNPNKTVLGSRSELRQAFTRTAILSNEKYRGVRLAITDSNLQVTANNPTEQEEAEENISVNYQGDALEIGFNVTYVLDVLDVLNNDQIKITASDAKSSALIEEFGSEDDSLYVVMPMRL